VAAELFAAAGAGLALGITFSPFIALAGAALAAALYTAGRTWAAALVLLGAWALGDGVALLSQGTDAFAGPGLVSGGSAAQWVVLVLWVIVGFGVGYALPAWAGAFVGARVTHGTGWLAAGMVAVTASVALAMLGGGFAA
jgi:hypothetical protein